MRLPTLLALGSLTVIFHAAPACAQAAAETALTTAVTSTTAGAVAPKIGGNIHFPSIASSSGAASRGTVHRYTRHTGAPTTVHRIPRKTSGKTDQTAATHPPRVTYRRIQ